MNVQYSILPIHLVGRPLPGTVTNLDPNNRELIYTGSHIFAGYMKMPDKTAETIDPDGFMHSGDVVKVSSFLVVLYDSVFCLFLFCSCNSQYVFFTLPSSFLFRLMIVFKMALQILVSLALQEESRNSSSQLEEKM